MDTKIIIKGMVRIYCKTFHLLQELYQSFITSSIVGHQEESSLDVLFNFQHANCSETEKKGLKES